MDNLNLQLKDKQKRTSKDQKAIADGARIIDLALASAGATGYWQAIPSHHTKWTSQKRFKVKSLNEERRQILVVVRPGDNGTAWEINLCGPMGLDLSSLRGIMQRMAHVEALKVETPVEKELAEAGYSREELAEVFPEGPPDQKSWESKVFESMEFTAEAESVEAAPYITQVTQEEKPTDVPLDTASLLRLSSRIGKVAQRFQERERQINLLTANKAREEEAAERALAELQTTETLLRQLLAEREADTEAASVQKLANLWPEGT